MPRLCTLIPLASVHFIAHQHQYAADVEKMKNHMREEEIGASLAWAQSNLPYIMPLFLFT